MAAQFETFDRSGVVLVRPSIHGDHRGIFTETWRLDEWTAAGVCARFVQDNLSRSAAAGTVRGLHYQAPPHAQAKLVRCVHGAIRDVAVDLRRGSPSYGTVFAADLCAENGHQLYVPPGFAHGFATHAPDSVVEYRCSDYYAPGSEGGLAPDDPDLAIDWGIDLVSAVMSERDRNWPRFAGFESPFDHNGESH